MIFIVLYLSSIISANLLVAQFGPEFSIINAFLFIGLDLTCRDILHERWKSNLWLKMLLLIGSGSALSYLFNQNSVNVALASFFAFLIAGFIDTVVYQILRRKSYMVKVNGSNVFSSLADSIVFPVIAFGLPVLWPIVLGQFIAKVFGGALWSIIINFFRGQVFTNWLCRIGIHLPDRNRELDYGIGRIAPCKNCGENVTTYNPYMYT